MDHWYLTAPQTATRLDEPVPTPGPGEVLVRIAHTAISPGSNVHVWRSGSYAGAPSEMREDLLYMGSGVVAALGPDVTTHAVGDPVVLPTGHQAFTVAAASAVHRVPADLALREAAISYLCSWSVSALHLGRYRAAETVVVVGQGLVGASAALVADLMGARVLALDVDPARVAFSRSLGIGAVEQPGSDGFADRAAAFLSATGPAGPDLILETTGSWHGLRQAIALARDYTRVAIMGIYRQPPPADLALDLFGLLNGYPSKFHYGRLEFIGVGSDPDTVVGPAPHLATRASNWQWVLWQAARGRLPLGRLITNVLPPESIGTALEQLSSGTTAMVGVVFDWPEAAAG